VEGKPINKEQIIAEFQRLNQMIQEQEKELKLTQYYKNQIDQMERQLDKSFGGPSMSPKNSTNTKMQHPYQVAYKEFDTHLSSVGLGNACEEINSQLL
jgi:YesN/AraC family two-component response regulator